MGVVRVSFATILSSFCVDLVNSSTERIKEPYSVSSVESLCSTLILYASWLKRFNKEDISEIVL